MNHVDSMQYWALTHSFVVQSRAGYITLLETLVVGPGEGAVREKRVGVTKLVVVGLLRVGGGDGLVGVTRANNR